MQKHIDIITRILSNYHTIQKNSNTLSGFWELLKCYTSISILIYCAFSDVFLNSKLKPKNSQAYINAINTGVTQPISVNHQELTDLINTILEPLFLGKIKAQEIFTPELSDKLNQYAF